MTARVEPEPAVAQAAPAAAVAAVAAAEAVQEAAEPALEAAQAESAEPAQPEPVTAKLSDIPADEPEVAMSAAEPDDADIDDELDMDIDLETQDTVGTKRRGIRLKQDLN